MPRIPVYGLIVLLVLATAAAVGVVLTRTGESAGPESDVALADVAAAPEEFAGEQVVVSGEVAENDEFSLADVHVGFVIGDDAGAEVIVLPQPGTSVPELDADSVVRVTGVVRVVAPNERTDTGAVAQGGALSESGTEATIEATRITVPGGDLDDAPG